MPGQSPPSPFGTQGPLHRPHLNPFAYGTMTSLSQRHVTQSPLEGAPMHLTRVSGRCPVHRGGNWDVGLTWTCRRLPRGSGTGSGPDPFFPPLPRWGTEASVGSFIAEGLATECLPCRAGPGSAHCHPPKNPRPQSHRAPRGLVQAAPPQKKRRGPGARRGLSWHPRFLPQLPHGCCKSWQEDWPQALGGSGVGALAGPSCGKRGLLGSQDPPPGEAGRSSALPKPRPGPRAPGGHRPGVFVSLPRPQVILWTWHQTHSRGRAGSPGSSMSPVLQLPPSGEHTPGQACRACGRRGKSGGRGQHSGQGADSTLGRGPRLLKYPGAPAVLIPTPTPPTVFFSLWGKCSHWPPPRPPQQAPQRHSPPQLGAGPAAVFPASISVLGNYLCQGGHPR